MQPMIEHDVDAVDGVERTRTGVAQCVARERRKVFLVTAHDVVSGGLQVGRGDVSCAVPFPLCVAFT